MKIISRYRVLLYILYLQYALNVQENVAVTPIDIKRIIHLVFTCYLRCLFMKITHWNCSTL